MTNYRYLTCSKVPGADSIWERQLNLTEDGLLFLPDPKLPLGEESLDR